MLTDGSGRSAARLARLVRDQEVGGSTPLAPTIFHPLIVPNMNHSALILVAVGLATLHAAGGCAPAPKYRSHPGPIEAAPRQGVSGDAGIPDLGIRLLSPVKGFDPARITSPFGIRPSTGRRHDGVDIKAKPGEEILAAASGIVAFSGRQRGYGNVVILDHGNGVSTLYAHLFYASVRAGDSIRAGEAVGRAGKRGRATGTHLHFEVRRRGSPIDPAPQLWLDSGGE
jgi:murein DD-endopeptidase MepM/ murein hydrolase activator NlpD